MSAQPSIEPVLSVTGLRVGISTPAGRVYPVDGVSLSVAPGETLGLVGESGGGKTMTVLAVMGLLPEAATISAGQIRVNGRELTRMTPAEMCSVRGRDIGMVFQDPMTSLNPTIPVGEQITEAVRTHRSMDASEARARVIDLLGLVGVAHPEERMKAYPHQLSGGMRQRLMIAMALACEPSVLIADEPTTALDVTIQAQILDLIDELRLRLGMAVVLVTHDLGVVAGRTDRVAVMYAGRVVEVASTADLFAHPRHRYTQALLAAATGEARNGGWSQALLPGLPPDLGSMPSGCRFAPRCSFVLEACTAGDPDLEGVGPHLHACRNPTSAGEAVRPAAPSIRSGYLAAPAPDRTLDDAPILRVEHVEKTFAVTSGVLQRRVGSVSALADVSLEIARGTTYGLVGESGSGKTTLGRAIVGLDKPTSGRILVDGVELSALPKRQRQAKRRDVTLVFQNAGEALDPRMRVRSIVAEPLEIHRVGGRTANHTRAAELLDEVGLSPSLLERYPRELSGGQLQRIGLARALALEPKLIVADEPVSSLDVSVQAQILALMTALQASRGISYLLISHDLSVVRHLSRNVGVMYLGRLVEEGPVEAVYQNSLHPYTRTLIDSVPSGDPVLERERAGRRIYGEMPSALEPPSGCRFRTRCPRAQQRCASEVPQLVRRSPDGHAVACHFPLDQPAPANAATITEHGAAA